MQIGVNALYLLPGGVGGTEIYLRSLLKALARIDTSNRYRVFTNRETADLCPGAPNFEAIPQAVSATSRPSRLLWEQFRLPLEGIDVLWNPGFTAPVFAPCPQVTVFHDLQHKRHPEFFRRLDLPFWNLFLWGAVQRSVRLIAVSDETARDLTRYYGVKSSRIDVVPHGVDERFFGLRRTPEMMLLYTSTLHPHKNHERLLRVFARFREQHPGWRLVFAGMRGFAAAEVEKSVAALNLGEAVEITGWIPREELYDLYSRAGAFIYPSRFEGFGMPILEALACGIPTACSDIEPLRSVAGDAAVRFSPDDESAMLKAIQTVCCDPPARVRLAAAGPARAGQFRWEDAARKTLASLTSAASPPA